MTNVTIEVLHHLSFWTHSRDKVWFEWQIRDKDHNIHAIGAFGEERQQAIRYAARRVHDKFPGLTLPNVEVENGS